jgi:hypothetical protein
MTTFACVFRILFGGFSHGFTDVRRDVFLFPSGQPGFRCDGVIEETPPQPDVETVSL